MTTTTLTPTERRAALLDLARALARRARRTRYTRRLAAIRHIGAQLDKLDPTDPVAPDYLDTAAQFLDGIRASLEPIDA